MRTYNRKRRYPFRACNIMCADGFRCDRQHGAMYGPYRRDDGSWIINAETASMEWNMCVYCNRSGEADQIKPDPAFTLKIKIGRDSVIVVRAYDDAGDDNAGRVKLRVEVRQAGAIVFPLGSLYCALHGSSDGIAARELVLSLVAMKPGDTDRDYFDNYTPAQLEWAQRYGDDLSCEMMYRYQDNRNGNNGKLFSSCSAARAYHDRERRRYQALKLAEHNRKEGSNVLDRGTV